MEQKVDEEITFKFPLDTNQTNPPQVMDNLGEQTATAEVGSNNPTGNSLLNTGMIGFIC